MATFLYRMGLGAYRRAWIVIAVWMLAVAGILGAGVVLNGQTSESFAIPGTESQDTIDTLSEVFPSAAGAQVQVVYAVPEGESVDDDRYRSVIEATGTAIEDVEGVNAVISPFSEYASGAISEDKETAFTQVQLDGSSEEVTLQTLDDLTATRSIAEEAGMDIAFGGQVFQDNTFGITITEVFGVLFAGVVLIVTFGSLAAAGMPLLMALVGVGVAVGGITVISAFVPVSSTAPLLALMLGLAVGIDYSLFILSRHRLQLANGVDPEESAASSVATAGSAVVFAGLTVIIALVGLLIVGIPFLSVMGISAAFAVLIAVAAAITLLPAILGLAKGRLAPKPGGRAHRRAMTQDSGKATVGRRWVGLVLKAPIVAVLAVVALLGVMAVPALSLDLNLPDGSAEPEESTQHQAFDLIEKGFGPGYNGPLVIAVDITQTTDIADDLDAIRNRLGDLPTVAFVGQGLPNPTVDTAIIQVMPETAPDAPETKALVQSIRDLAPEIESDLGTPIAVTGATAVSIDISNRLSDALVPFALIVVGLSILLLTMVFRSIFVPVSAALGFLLSVVASLGATVAIFQWGWFPGFLDVNPGPILSFLPILLIAVLFGLAMDYQVFLVSGMREEYVKTHDPRASVVVGFAHSARVVTAAALIMFFVFFAFVPEGSGAIKGIAFALAIGVFLDAFLVRMTLIPAAMALAGRAGWWLPAWLERRLPNVDIEGEGLRRHKDDVAWAETQSAAISATGLSIGLPENAVGPIDLTVPGGSVLFVAGSAPLRRVFGATLSGRLDPVSGRLQVLGAPLPSERGLVLRQVALADVGAGNEGSSPLSVGEVISARLAFALPWYRVRPAVVQLALWLGRLNRALSVRGENHDIIDADTPLAALSDGDHGAALVAAALAEHPGIVFVDVGDELPAGRDGADFTTILCTLAPAHTTLVLAASRFPAIPDAGTSAGGSEQEVAGRTIRYLDLHSYDREAVGR
jgi:RND superfamily putative drug exporter